MIKQVYISSNLDNLLYELETVSKNTSLIYSEDLSFPEIVSLHKKTLFNNDKLRCFLNLETVETTDLVKLLDSNIQLNVIWCFSKINKNSSLYKQLQGRCPIQTCSGVDTYQDRKKFITKLVKENKLDSTYIESFMKTTSSNKYLIKTEIESLSYLINVVKRPDLTSTNIYALDSDIFKLVDAIINCNIEEFYFYFNKLESSLILLQFHSIILSKLKSLIFFSKNLDDLAQTSWKTFDIKQTKALANKLGFQPLLKIYNYSDSLLGDFYSEKPLITRLCNIIFFISQVS